ncbi:granzyme K-like [Paramisgurnus dabryanus]|uniref:granzyme K-like n=1 Tax=Paramisgurnus dabryanus TaxID=90735 RepID=UPI003CCF2310
MDVHSYLIIYTFLLIAFFKVSDCSEVSIVGGKDVKKLEPWMVSIQKDEHHVCGGILIKDQWVLTAAHCKTEPIKSVSVLIGTLSLKTLKTKGSQRVGILSYEHPKTYNEQTKRNDIMLIKLNKKVKTKPKKLPNKEQNLRPETKCVVKGWGTQDSEVLAASDKLQMLDVTIVDKELCTCNYKDELVITNDMLCTRNKETNRGPCQGDSGGPLECKKNLVGVVSGSRGCGVPGKPTVYTFLSNKHIFWINNVLKKQFNSTTY